MQSLNFATKKAYKRYLTYAPFWILLILNSKAMSAEVDPFCPSTDRAKPQFILDQEFYKNRPLSREAWETPGIEQFPKTTFEGYDRNKSESLLDNDTKKLLSIVLRAFREDGLFTDRQKLFDLLGIKSERVINTNEPDQTKYFYEEKISEFFGKKILGWSGQYTYYPPILRERWDTVPRWGEALSVEFDNSLVCISSKAAEGFMNIGFRNFRHTVVDAGPGGWKRHQDIFAHVSASNFFENLPSILMRTSNACLQALTLTGSFGPAIGDEKAYLPPKPMIRRLDC